MILGGEKVEISCVVEIEQTQESLHAHAVPDGIEIRPGDEVIVHNPPYRIDFGEKISVPCRATVTRAGMLGRAWTHVTSLFEITELYEVGFQPRESIVIGFPSAHAIGSQPKES